MVPRDRHAVRGRRLAERVHAGTICRRKRRSSPRASRQELLTRCAVTTNPGQGPERPRPETRCGRRTCRPRCRGSANDVHVSWTQSRAWPMVDGMSYRSPVRPAGTSRYRGRAVRLDATTRNAIRVAARRGGPRGRTVMRHWLAHHRPCRPMADRVSRSGRGTSGTWARRTVPRSPESHTVRTRPRARASSSSPS